MDDLDLVVYRSLSRFPKIWFPDVNFAPSAAAILKLHEKILTIKPSEPFTYQ